MDDYKDILNLPHHVSKTHPQMSLEQRSAQFAPFSALTGYADMITETARLTQQRIEIGDELKDEINEKLQVIQNLLQDNQSPQVCLKHFVQDAKKDGGKYVSSVGTVIKFDRFYCFVLLRDIDGNVLQIFFNDIVDIQGDVFERWDND